jgi:hypothetical protein
MIAPFPERKPKATLTWENMAVNPIGFAVLLEENHKKSSLPRSRSVLKIIVLTVNPAAELPLD